MTLILTPRPARNTRRVAWSFAVAIVALSAFLAAFAPPLSAAIVVLVGALVAFLFVAYGELVAMTRNADPNPRIHD